MKNFKVFELNSNVLRSVCGGEIDAVGKTVTLKNYTAEVRNDKDSNADADVSKELNLLD